MSDEMNSAASFSLDSLLNNAGITTLTATQHAALKQYLADKAEQQRRNAHMHAMNKAMNKELRTMPDITIVAGYGKSS